MMQPSHQVIRTGEPPNGRDLLEQVRSAAIDHYGNQSDEDLAAIFAYLRSLPPTKDSY